MLARGVLPCQVLFIGEGPGKTEDKEGYPFVGASGEVMDLWTKYLEDAWPATTHNPPTWAITNTVACRPCNSKFGPNRAPTDLEQSNCAPRFGQLLTMAKPEVIILVGKVATNYWLSQSSEVVSRYQYLELPHPSYLIQFRGGKDGKGVHDAKMELFEFLFRSNVHGTPREESQDHRRGNPSGPHGTGDGPRG